MDAQVALDTYLIEFNHTVSGVVHLRYNYNCNTNLKIVQYRLLAYQSIIMQLFHPWPAPDLLGSVDVLPISINLWMYRFVWYLVSPILYQTPFKVNA